MYITMQYFTKFPNKLFYISYLYVFLQELCVKKLKQEVNKYLTSRLKSITLEQVTFFIQSSVRTHLGWLVVVGSITGGILGLLSQASGIGQLT